MIRTLPRTLVCLLALLLLALAVPALSGCPADGDDDDDDDRIIPPPDGCSFNSLSNVTFTFNIHFGGEDYPQDELVALMEEVGAPTFAFGFPGQVTEFGADGDSNRLAVTVTEIPPEGEDPPDDPNWVRVVYQLPLEYTLPVAFDEVVGVELVLDISNGTLIHAFSFWELLEDGSAALLFLAEPSNEGLAYTPGAFHPVFSEVDVRDRACPNLGAQPCAKNYNLSLVVETQPPEDADEDAVGELFELWPTESVDFQKDGLDLRLVNVWSYAFREVDEDCTGFDYSADRFSYFVTRSAFAPAR